MNIFQNFLDSFKTIKTKVTPRMEKPNVELKLKRFHDDDQCTIGKFFVDDDLYCYTLEDPIRDTKIKGKTAIPAGRYEIKFREALSGLTKHYRKKYDWFTWHLELQDVPNYQYVYLHIGNYPEDTDGCILVGKTYDLSKPAVWTSTPVYEELYKMLTKKLNSGHRVFITIE